MDRKQITTEILRCRPAVMAYAMALVRDYHVAEDLFQETVVAALSDLKKTAQADNLRAWLLGITRNKALQLFEREGRESPIGKLDLMAQQALLEEPLSSRAEHRLEALQHCLKGLPAKTFDVVRMRFEDGDSYSAIAQGLRMSQQAVRKVVSRAREALYHCIQGRLRRFS